MRKLASGLLILACSATAMGADPSWWNQESVIDSSASHSPSANYVPGNVGQLKNIAAKAKLHFDYYLPGGAGSTINALVTAFTPQNGVSYTSEAFTALRLTNYAVANAGQLKAVAKPFYDRLVAAGYDPKVNLIARGYPANWSTNYPWPAGGATADNYRPANIGQFKMVFSFDLSGTALVDTDADSLQDAWETQYFSNLNRNGSLDYDNDGLSDLTEFLLQADPVVANGTGPTFATTKLSVFTPLR